MEPSSLTRETCVVRKTNVHKGRFLSVVPGKTAVQYLHYGRIILGGTEVPVRFSTGDHETALIVLKGSATLETPAGLSSVGRFDALYIPRDSEVEVRPTAEGCDIAEVAAPVARLYPERLIRFDEIQKDPTLHFKAGGPGTERDLNILIGKNVEAGRILAGVTFSAPGNWTSWPPHEHSVMLEEAYLYFDMPAPSFGVQLVYTDPEEPELAVVVRDGDVVIIPRGFHPNVAAPGGSINFLWMMAARREGDDRQFGVVNVQPDFAAKGSGLEASRK
jgi:5-deoxy-glucuronate isomerase